MGGGATEKGVGKHRRNNISHDMPYLLRPPSVCKWNEQEGVKWPLSTYIYDNSLGQLFLLLPYGHISTMDTFTRETVSFQEHVKCHKATLTTILKR